MEQTPTSFDAAIVGIIAGLSALPDGSETWNAADRADLERLGVRFRDAIADAARAGAGSALLVGRPARNFAAALGELAHVLKKAGLLPEADQIPRDPSPERCWADMSRDGRGDHLCSADAETDIGLCARHAQQLRSAW